MKNFLTRLVGIGIIIISTLSYTYGQEELGFAFSPTSPQFRQGEILKLSHPKANQLLSNVYKKYDSFTGVEAVLLVTAKDGVTTSSKRGTVFVKDQKYKIETPDQLIVSDGKTNWLYLKSTNNLQISRHVPNDDSFFSYPAVLLKKYQKDYITKLITERTVAGKTIMQIDLIPFDGKANYKKVSVEVDKNNYQITKLTIFENDQTNFTIKVESLKTNSTNISDQLFTFDASKVPSSNIIDLR